jgi:YD repeat-containing protein
MKRLNFACSLIATFTLLSGFGFGQAQDGVSPHSAWDGEVNITNQNLLFSIPVFKKFDFTYNLTVNNYAQVVPGGGNFWTINTDLVGAATGSGKSSFKGGLEQCDPGPPPVNSNHYTNWAFTDSLGTKHYFPFETESDPGACLGYGQTGSGVALDGSGYYMSVVNGNQASVWDVAGNVPTFSFGVTTPDGINAASYDGVWPVSLVLTNGSGSPATYTWKDASGANKTVQVNYSAKTKQTAFGCTITEIGPGTAYVPTSVSLPDSSSYTITYETTPGHSPNITGRIASIRYPTGGTTSYTYTGGNNGVDCSRKFVPVLTKTTPSGVKTFTHTYGNPQSTVTVVDEAGNQADYSVTDGYYSIGLLNSAKFYTGNGGGKTLLSTTVYSYIGGWNVWLQQEDADTTPAGKSNFSRVEKKWSASGNLTETSLYDYGLVLVSKTALVYGSYSGGTCNLIGTNVIRNKVCSSITTNGSGAPVATTYNTYDSKGHNTQTQQWVGGVNYLTSYASYNPTTGALETTQAPNGTIATITNGACNSLLPTSVSVGGLSGSRDWDCTGGVVKSITDANSQQTSFTHADPFWRQDSVTDPALVTTTTTYTPNTTESKLNFNGSVSTRDNLTTLDSSGRPIVDQTKKSQSSTSYDTVSRTYDAASRPYTVSVPCATTAGATCPTVASTQTYDGLGRPLVNTNNITLGTITNVYTANDVLSTIPAGTGGTELSKKKQAEYDGLGRLVSVCEITSAPGSSDCGQTVAANGFKTSYVYDALGRILSVTQGSQTRSFVYDGLGRKTSETNPELGTNGANGTVSYTYDSATGCTGSSAGALIKTQDPVGNVTCRQYDSLQRLTSITYSGPYSANTPTKTFVYDSASVNGQSMAFANGRLAEAYTGAHSTDLGFSYDARGQIATLYESTPHSGGFYTINQSHWENGSLKTLNGIGLPTFTYNLEGEGSVSTVSASTGTNPVSATAYNAASQVTSVTFGSNDVASFSYVNVGQAMSKYQETINGTATFGSLTWNTNGSLKKLAITDPFNTPDSHTCTYVYDDSARVSSATCGTTWAQTFTYDRYGNITKGGNSAWTPGYNPVNNHYALPQVTYDLNGNLTNDSFHNYTWDADGHTMSVDSTTCGVNGVCLTYDALGRQVERTNGAGFVQYVYVGTTKLALMNAQT